MLGHASPDATRRRSSLNLPAPRRGLLRRLTMPLPSPTNSPRPTLIAAVAGRPRHCATQRMAGCPCKA